MHHARGGKIASGIGGGDSKPVGEGHNTQISDLIIYQEEGVGGRRADGDEIRGGPVVMCAPWIPEAGDRRKLRPPRRTNDRKPE